MSNKTILGIDPGNTGGLCLLSDTNRLVWPMPTMTIEINSKKRTKINCHALLAIIKEADPDHVVVEKVGAMPRDGAVGSFSFGFGAGLIEGCVVSLGLPLTYVTPPVWKKATATPKDKDASRMRASHLMPDLAHNWDRKKDDGKSDAALLAYWGRLNVK